MTNSIQSFIRTPLTEAHALLKNEGNSVLYMDSDVKSLTTCYDYARNNDKSNLSFRHKSFLFYGIMLLL